MDDEDCTICRPLLVPFKLKTERGRFNILVYNSDISTRLIRTVATTRVRLLDRFSRAYTVWTLTFRDEICCFSIRRHSQFWYTVTPPNIQSWASWPLQFQEGGCHLGAACGTAANFCGWSLIFSNWQTSITIGTNRDRFLLTNRKSVCE